MVDALHGIFKYLIINNLTDVLARFLLPFFALFSRHLTVMQFLVGLGHIQARQ